MVLWVNGMYVLVLVYVRVWRVVSVYGVARVWCIYVVCVCVVHGCGIGCVFLCACCNSA